MPETMPIPYTTLSAMVGTYQNAVQTLKDCFSKLDDSEKQLANAFGEYGPHLSKSYHGDYDEVTPILQRMHKDAWKILYDKMGIRKAMAIKDAADLDKQIEEGKDLPEITEENILRVIDGTLASVDKMFKRAVHEVFEWLRPPMWDKYKTNSRFEIGHRVIKGGCVECHYNHQWQINYYRQDYITSLDNVFSILDGKGIVKSHRGPLTDAIAACHTADGGETEYFRFKCYHNGNLHLEFKRLDLLAKLNQIGGGSNLKPQN